MSIYLALFLLFAAAPALNTSTRTAPPEPSAALMSLPMPLGVSYLCSDCCCCCHRSPRSWPSSCHPAEEETPKILMKYLVVLCIRGISEGTVKVVYVQYVYGRDGLIPRGRPRQDQIPHPMLFRRIDCILTGACERVSSL